MDACLVGGWVVLSRPRHGGRDGRRPPPARPAARHHGGRGEADAGDPKEGVAAVQKNPSPPEPRKRAHFPRLRRGRRANPIKDRICLRSKIPCRLLQESSIELQTSNPFLSLLKMHLLPHLLNPSFRTTTMNRVVRILRSKPFIIASLRHGRLYTLTGFFLAPLPGSALRAQDRPGAAPEAGRDRRGALQPVRLHLRGERFPHGRAGRAADRRLKRFFVDFELKSLFKWAWTFRQVKPRGAAGERGHRPRWRAQPRAARAAGHGSLRRPPRTRTRVCRG